MPVVSDFVHTLGVQGKSIDREILRPTEWTSQRKIKFVIYKSFISLEKGGKTLARGKVNLGVQIRSLEIHVDDSMVETPCMSVQYTHTHTHTRGCAFSRPWLTEFRRVCLPGALSNIYFRERERPKFWSTGRSWYFAVITRKNILDANFSREPATFFHAALRLVVVCLRDASLPR